MSSAATTRRSPPAAPLAADAQSETDAAGAARLYLWLVAGWAVAFSPVFWVLLAGQAGADHLAHFPITIGLAAYLLWRDWSFLPPPSLKLRLSGGVLIALGLAVLGFGLVIRSGWVGTLAALVVLAGLLNWVGGRAAWRVMRPAWLMALLLLPPPFGLDRSLIIGLQKLASGVAGVWLDGLGIANLATGVVIRTPGNDFLVEEACSGINSLFAAAAVAVFWVLYNRYHLVRSVLFLATVLFWVLVANAVRVWAIVYFEIRWSTDLTAEPSHTLVGLSTFAGALLLAASSDWLLRFILPPPVDEEPDAGGGPIAQARKPSKRFRSAGVLAVVTIFMFCAVGMHRGQAVSAAPNVIADASLMPTVAAGLAPEQVGPWKLRSHERIERDPSNAFGMVSEAFVYSDGGDPVVISLDGPYDAWHDLGYCYGAIGWQLRDSENLDLASFGELQPIPCVSLSMYRGGDQRSLVMYTSFDSSGQVISPPASHGSVLRNLTNRLGMTTATQTVGGEAVDPPVFQVQMHATSTSEWTPPQRASLDQLYDVMRRRLIGLFRPRPSEVQPNGSG